MIIRRKLFTDSSNPGRVGKAARKRRTVRISKILGKENKEPGLLKKALKIVKENPKMSALVGTAALATGVGVGMGQKLNRSYSDNQIGDQLEKFFANPD